MIDIVVMFPMHNCENLYCVWFATGETRRPLACRWIAAHRGALPASSDGVRPSFRAACA